MKNQSLYLLWYTSKKNLVYDLRSSGIASYPYTFHRHTYDLGLTNDHGNHELITLLAHRYHVSPDNIFLSSDGTSGQNTRIIQLLAERNPQKNEAIIEYPTYEPLLRVTQEYYTIVHQINRIPSNGYHIDIDILKKKISHKTVHGMDLV